MHDDTPLDEAIPRTQAPVRYPLVEAFVLPMREPGQPAEEVDPTLNPERVVRVKVDGETWPLTFLGWEFDGRGAPIVTLKLRARLRVNEYEAEAPAPEAE